MANIRNSRTTHPRKQARRDRAAERFSVNLNRRHDKKYMADKTVEANSLGIQVAA